MRWIRVALPVCWVALAAATHYPRVPIPTDVAHGDKVIHFVAFGLLTFLFWLFIAARTRTLTATSVWIVALVLIPYAALDEYTQQFVGRTSDLADLGANVAGITSVLAAVEIRRRRTELRR